MYGTSEQYIVYLRDFRSSRHWLQLHASPPIYEVCRHYVGRYQPATQPHAAEDRAMEAEPR